MKKILLSAALILSFVGSAQVTVFEDSFETHEDFAISGFGGWVTVDLDLLTTYIASGTPASADPWPNQGQPQAWIIFNPAVAGVVNSTATECTTADNENRNFDPHTGAKYAGSWASIPVTGGGQANNDWLFSPPVNLGASDNNVSFWVKALSSCYGNEEFRVAIYTGTGTPDGTSNITFISGLFGNILATPTWTEKTYAIPASAANSTIRIGIQNTGDDHYLLMVDDFIVTSSNLSTKDVLAAKFSTYPNPSKETVNLSNSDNISVSEIQITDMNGRIVKTIPYSDAPSDIQISISDLSAGVYMMNIDTDQGKAVKKIVKQ